jgi:hypothetical protein
LEAAVPLVRDKADDEEEERTIDTGLKAKIMLEAPREQTCSGR